jgi:prephenate dehydrogenase
MDSVAVIGLGLIGGSLARDLRALGVRVLGYDTDTDALRAACDEGVVAAPLDASFAGLADTEVVVLAVPVEHAADVLAALRPQLAHVRLVTDVGSTKAGIVAAAERLGIADRFVGAHPLAGDHRAGFAAARAGLFRDARVYLCPEGGTSREARRVAKDLWHAVGARTLEIDATEHDRLVAWTSHLPQALSTALARALAEARIPPGELGPGGRDMIRLASSPAPLWTGIALENAAWLTDALAAMEAELRELREALARGDREAARRFYERHERSGASSPQGGHA